MITDLFGPYSYDQKTIEQWRYALSGVYYCGNHTTILYVGKATGGEGIRGRLLDHRDQDHWPDVTLFWYRECGTEREALDLELSEIKRLHPKYNTQGK